MQYLRDNFEPVSKPHVVNAYLDCEKMLLIHISMPPVSPFVLSDVIVTDITTGRNMPVTSVVNARPDSSSMGFAGELLKVMLADVPDITHTLVVGLTGYYSHVVFPRKVLEEADYIYEGDDLGACYTKAATSFRVWAPTASDITLLLYKSEDGPLDRQIELQRSEGGTWHVCVTADLESWYYLYRVTVLRDTHTVVDPYARAIAVNATRGMIVDLSQTNPGGWNNDRYVHLAHPVDAIIYETHIRDFSIDEHSGMAHKGKYLAFTERGTTGPQGVVTGVESLIQLGITHIQVLPIAEFASVDDTSPDQYNWGYDPRNYNVPEGSYAVMPQGIGRIRELKEMISSLHAANIGVVLDVVYNHTFATQTSDFDKLVPHYYYRTDEWGNYTNGSGVGNELAAERPMVRKFIRDSLQYWMEEYHVDGFRFDLMALLGVDTMTEIVQNLQHINPCALLYGEPWTGGVSSLSSEQLLTKGRQKGLGLGVFNDDLRNGLVGSVFDRQAWGFVTGASNRVDAVKNGVVGSITDFAATPEETVNYVSCHDNLTLWDKIAYSHPSLGEEQRIWMDKLAQVVIMTAQGMPFIQGGDEFLRTKGGNENSYNAGDRVNRFDWSRKAQYKEVFDYYAGLLHLRRTHPAFRMTSGNQVRQHLSFLECPATMLAFQLREYANGDSWRHILVIYNPDFKDTCFDLPSGVWTMVLSRDNVCEAGIVQVTQTVTVAASSGMILYQN